jgi:hypothetical protein
LALVYRFQNGFLNGPQKMQQDAVLRYFVDSQIADRQNVAIQIGDITNSLP